MEFIKEFKYQTYFDENNLTNCPPKTYKTINGNAYRYIFEDLGHENNFRPVNLITPQRINNTEDINSKCQGFGISLYADLEDAKKNYEKYAKRSKNFSKIVGDKIALIELTIFDGVGSDINTVANTHFTFHEYASTNLYNSIRNILDVN